MRNDIDLVTLDKWGHIVGMHLVWILSVRGSNLVLQDCKDAQSEKSYILYLML